jgi:hypothetical protein
MQTIVSPNIVPVKLDQALNSNKSITGLRKMMYYLKYDRVQNISTNNGKIMPKHAASMNK